MYILTVKTYQGTSLSKFSTEAEALHRMRLWAKHPTFISAKVETMRPVIVVVGGRI